MGAILSFLKGVVSFVFGKTIPKFFAFFALYFIVLEFTPVLANLIGLDSLANSISNLFGGLPSGVLYFLAIFKVGTGLKIVFSAYVIRFIIRRIPVIG